MKKLSILILAILATGLTSMMLIERQDLKSSRPKGTETIQPTFQKGMITFKIKEGMGKFNRQSGDVYFNIPSLDQLADKFEIDLLEQRFKFNPLKLKKGMPDLSRIYRIEFPDRFSVQAVVQAFENNPFIEYAEPVPEYTFCEIPDDELYDQCQHLPQISADSAWDIHHGEDGEEVVIGIIDTGTDWKHPDLAENTWQNLGEDADNDGVTMVFNGTEWERDPDDLNGFDDDNNGFVDDVIGWDFHEEVSINDGSNPDPLWNLGPWTHGTHCSGIAAGRTNNEIGISSVAWNIKYMPVQSGNGTNYVPYGYDGIIYAAENGADIISNSWTGLIYSAANQEVISYAQQLGSIVVAAAGNENSQVLGYPASYTGTISVGALSVDDTRADYSSFGPAVDISGPGGGWEGGILSTIPNNEYDLSSGTSMSTPLVAGCIGFLKSYHPEWTNDQLIIQLLGTADDINTINPDYQNMLGSGRVNAYHMLLDENVSMLPEFKLALENANQVDENENDINEPGEEVIMNFEIHNFVPYVGEDNVTVILQCADPEIELLDGTATVNIPPEGNFAIEDQFLIKVGENAHSHFVDFSLHFQSNTPVVYGQDMNYQLLIAPSGIFVFEGEHNKRDYSGMFIRSFLDRLGYEVTYANLFPTTLRGFDAVFTSHGNSGEDWSHGHLITEEHAVIFQDYLEDGGNLYIEKDRLFASLQSLGSSSYQALKELFGVGAHISPPSIQNKIDSLIGITNTSFEGITFSKSNQINNWRIEKLIPLPDAAISFEEYGYGNVSIMNDGISTYGHKTFYLSYALAELLDNSSMNSRYNVLLKILEFFGYSLPDGYLLSNFTSGKTFGSAPLDVQFSDISLSDSSYQINSWKWDFNGDGIIDKEEQNPEWTFSDEGTYDVTLIVSNGINSDTITKEEYIRITHGFLVYEGIEGAPCYSGTYINNYLLGHNHPTTFTTSFPNSLLGYGAVFLSFGNFGLNYTEVTDEMAAVIIQYLEDGGFVYLEGNDALGFDQASNGTLQNLFGLVDVEDGSTNEIDSLVGHPGLATDGMVFTSSTQPSNAFIDIFNPMDGNSASFTESDYGIVGVQYEGNNDQRTFCFSYVLSELEDTEFPSTRETLLNRICNYFDIIIVDVDEQQANQTMQFMVYPNPICSQATVSYSLNQTSTVSINLYNLKGVLIKSVINQQQPIGYHRDVLDMNDLPVGIYFCKLITNDEIQTKKIIKL